MDKRRPWKPVTLAKGIETQEQAEMMPWLGCDRGAGLLLRTSHFR
jgi:EAL domain-containing protein (putative c-di-GMP-specific phosphodiesterase class I)